MCVINKNTLIKNFPFKEIRTKQKEVLEKVGENWGKYRYFVMECPTGFGKSPVSYAIGSSVKNSYLITATKQLQDQYSRDFEEPNVVNLKGKVNYRCNLKPEFNVELAPCITDSSILQDCKRKRFCTYYNQKEKALHSKIAVLSSSLFLAITNPIGKFIPRNTLIIDECHLLESQIVQWATLEISPSAFLKEYGLDLPQHTFKEGFIHNKDWLQQIWLLILKKKQEFFEEVQDKLAGKDPDLLTDEEMQELISSNSSYYKIDKLQRKLRVFFESTKKEKWICEPKADGLVLTPIEIDDIFHRYIDKMAIENVFFMSATILDTVGFAKSIGLKKENTAIIKVEPDFPPEKSPIIYSPCGKMNYNKIDETIPNIIEKVREILNSHPNEKAIIHTGNYKIAHAIYDGLKDKRLIIKNQGENNEAIIKKHTQSKEPTVLISPSLTTGVDLKDELSRFQIIVKLPFMSLSDTRIKKKNEIDDEWYVCEMFRSFVQAAGRSTRSADDWSTTYVLDSSFYYWVNKYKKWFSKNFLQRIRWK